MDEKTPTGGKYSERFLLRLTPGTIERIKRAAYGRYPEHLSASEWVRNLVERELTNPTSKTPESRKASKTTVKGGTA